MVFTRLIVKSNSARNVSRGDATSLMIDGLLFKKGEVTRAHKEMTKSKYKCVIMNSYQTRIRDGAEVPRDPIEFHVRINNEDKNFFLEQILRVLPSKNKLLKMDRLETPGFDGTNICVQCSVLSDSSHQITYCILPTYAVYALNTLPSWKEKF